SECFSELRHLWDDLNPKVEDADLDVKDVKRISALKKKIKELLKTKGITDFDLTYWEVEVDFDNLKKSLIELENFVKKYASPQTQIQAQNKKKGKRD
ncbi:8432_t:CDS:1, partial [Ambispora gerdemannii]